jgi:hypothetical protein
MHSRRIGCSDMTRGHGGAPHDVSASAHAGGGGGGGSEAAGEVFYSVLVEWWLTDGEEPLPLPSATGAAPAAPTPLGPAQSLR